jgi:hypothetical protein
VKARVTPRILEQISSLHLNSTIGFEEGEESVDLEDNSNLEEYNFDRDVILSDRQSSILDKIDNNINERINRDEINDLNNAVQEYDANMNDVVVQEYNEDIHDDNEVINKEIDYNLAYFKDISIIYLQSISSL